MKTVYEVNGRIFSKKEDAVKYEDDIRKKEVKEAKLKEEKEGRIKEINDVEKTLKHLKDQFYKDYETTTFPSFSDDEWNEFLDRIFR